jgi:uncharacterized protein (TIGR02466 family)
MSDETHSLFATRVYEADLAPRPGFEAFNAELEAACLGLAAEDRAGRAWCKAHGYGGYTSYAELKKRLDREAASFAGQLGFDLQGRRLKLDSLWVNVLKPGSAHSGHIHPNSVLSGTYYVRVPEGASAIRFEDPRLALMMAAPSREPGPFVYLQPQAGTVLMWESWLRHEVPANAARRERISVSFNYAWR